jgi:hypothetical protein
VKKVYFIDFLAKLSNCFTLSLYLTQAERFVDRKLDQAEHLLKQKAKKTKKWYSNLIGDDEGVKLNDFHVFLVSFAAGVALGVGTS